jgi:hypothetical protein
MQSTLRIFLTYLVAIGLIAYSSVKAEAAPKELVVTQFDNTIYLTDEAIRIKNNTGNFIPRGQSTRLESYLFSHRPKSLLAE